MDHYFPVPQISLFLIPTIRLSPCYCKSTKVTSLPRSARAFRVGFPLEADSRAVCCKDCSLLASGCEVSPVVRHRQYLPSEVFAGRLSDLALKIRIP